MSGAARHLLHCRRPSTEPESISSRHRPAESPPLRAIGWVNRTIGTWRSGALLAVLWAGRLVHGGEPGFPVEQIEFFENRIRPVLVEACYRCHSVESGKSKGGLLLDSQAGLLKGGQSGPALVPGKPDDTLLIKAIRYANKDLQMPPESAGGKLEAGKIADFESWVRMGAPDPRTGPPSVGAQAGGSDLEKARQHWAFRRVEAPPVPAVKNADWVRTPVDAFVLAGLEAKGLAPSPPADRHTLLRRVYFDLIGLPPSPDDMATFLDDRANDAFERVVERLLDSPRYGERWGRYWLDVARYADTKGYVFQEERRYGFSYTYRDYVIQAFNEDRPFDQFLIEQIAADRVLPPANSQAADGGAPNRASLAALGFLTLGRRFLNNQNDIIDDRIDVVTRGTQGLTVGCARCHDHKFDPISMRDYYALHGVFASSSEPEEKPTLGGSADSVQHEAYLKARAEIEARREAVFDAEVGKWATEQREKSGDYLLAAERARKLPADANLETFAGEHKVVPTVLRRWMELLRERALPNDPVFGPWARFAALADDGFAHAAGEVSAALAEGVVSGIEVNPLVRQALIAGPPKDLDEVAQRYGKLLKDVGAEWAATIATAGAAREAVPEGFSDPQREALRQLLFGPNAPANLANAEVRRLIARHLDNQTVKLRQELAALEWQHPGAPARAMALEDAPQAHNSRVFIRGNPGNPGDEVPRRFLEVLANVAPSPFTDGSGRLELARAIASRDNPLTARVFVNRVWAWRFGNPMVRTPSDLGIRTASPPHQDLLDWLAAQFMENGWSVKRLHRLMLLSNTYRQTSATGEVATGGAADPENTLLWRQNRRRLDFEAMRDSLLAVSGRLNLTAGGQPVDLLSAPFSGRRTVYGFIDRQNLPGLFRTFDFANPDVSSPGRFTTTVPQQALFLMNSPFVVEQARALASAVAGPGSAEGDSIAKLFARVYQRGPEAAEMDLARAFLARPVEAPEEFPAGWRYGLGRFDANTQAVVDFVSLTNRAQGRLSPEITFPLTDERGYACLTATGGHPGNTARFSVVRRWLPPADGVIRVEGTLKHESEQGDGVRARVVQEAVGRIGEWRVAHSSTNTAVADLRVHRGQAVDFVVDCLGGPAFDSFGWAPVIRLTPDTASGSVRREWRAEADFGSDRSALPRLSRLEQLAQVLLLSNEFAFAD